ncbi:hypothetical protein K402DRAFT_346188, partial [Aulographum hederae CBS 113979]
MSSKTQEARDLRRSVLNRVRNDWEWPAPTSSNPSANTQEQQQENRMSAFRSSFSFGAKHDRDREQDPYKFDSPDAVGGLVGRRIDARRMARKRKRRDALEEEMGWNEGLRAWVAMRNEWTGARSVEEVERESDGSHPLLPLSPPFLDPNSRVRAGITPAAYPDIYSKVVLSSRTPTVPINLADMTRALVQGWKDGGEWPPKLSAPEPMIARRRGEARPGKSGGEKEGRLAHHPHMRRGVEGVKRVLRLS